MAALLGVALAIRLWDAWVEDGLGRWAVDELATQTDSAYRLVLGDLSFNPLAGSIAFDSAIVAIDSTRNAMRAEPLPSVTARAEGCGVSGLDLVRLALGRSFNARVLECRELAARISLTVRESDSMKKADTTDVATTVHQVIQPLGLSAFRLARISFPSVSLELTLERTGPRGPASLVLERARFDAGGIAFDPEAATAERASLEATGLVFRPDTLIEIGVARLRAGFTDSTLSLAGAEHEPSIPESEWVRKVRVRRDRIHFALDSLQGRGVAYRAFLASGGIGIRSLELRGARLDVLSDQRIPPGPPRRHRTPQQMAAQTRSPLRFDTVLVRDGTIRYRERRLKKERPGVVTFEQLQATILDLDFPSRGDTLRIEVEARLMGEGPLTARAIVPLGAPDFRYRLSARLGRMPAQAFNRFLSENEAFRFDNGMVERIDVQQTVEGGRAITAVTPRYRDLSVEPTGDGGGVVGSVVRGVKEFVAQAIAVRSDNHGEDLRTGRTVRRYTPEQTWLQFLWFGIRDGVQAVLRE